jgi:hypothetical protein
MKKFSGYTKKFSGYMIFFPETKKISANNIDSSFQKCPLVKKRNLNDIFHARKGHFAPGKRALCKSWGGGQAFFDLLTSKILFFASPLG